MRKLLVPGKSWGKLKNIVIPFLKSHATVSGFVGWVEERNPTLVMVFVGFHFVLPNLHRVDL
jgi:hypothetical protein